MNKRPDLIMIRKVRVLFFEDIRRDNKPGHFFYMNGGNCVEKNEASQKIEQARLNLYAMKGTFTSPKLLKASQELDEYILLYYKQGYFGNRCQLG